MNSSPGSVADNLFNRNDTSFSPLMQSISISADVTALAIYFLLCIPLLLVYIGRKAYWIHIYFSCYCCGRYDKHSTRVKYISNKKLSLFLLHSALIYVFCQCFIQCIYITEHSLVNRWDPPNVLLLRNIMMNLRRILDMFSFTWQFIFFCILLLIWNYLSVVWIDRTPHGMNKRKWMLRSAYAFVFITLSSISILFFCTIISCVLLMFTNPSDPNWVEQALYFENLRILLLYTVVIPITLLISSLSGIYIIAMGIYSNIMIKKSAMYISSLEHVSHKNALMKQVSQQWSTHVKMSVSVFICFVFFLGRLLGIASYYLPMYDFVKFSLLKYIPDYLFVILLCFIYWPFKLCSSLLKRDHEHQHLLKFPKPTENSNIISDTMKNLLQPISIIDSFQDDTPKSPTTSTSSSNSREF